MKNKINDIYNTPIYEIELNLSLIKKLISFDIKTIGDLIKFSANDLAVKTKLGSRSISSIESKLKSLGLEFNKVDQIKIALSKDSLIYDLNLEPRIFNALNRFGIKTLQDLISLSSQELTKIDNINTISITKIDEILDSFGFRRGLYTSINKESSIFLLHNVDICIRRKLAYNEIRIIKDLISLSKKDLYDIFYNDVNKINLVDKIIHVINELGLEFEKEKENNLISLDSSIFILDIDLSIRRKLASRGIKTIKIFSELDVDSNKLNDFSILEQNKLSEIFIFLANYFNTCDLLINNEKSSIESDCDAIIECLKQNNPELVIVFQNIINYNKNLEEENVKLRNTIDEITNLLNISHIDSVNKNLFYKKKTKKS